MGNMFDIWEVLGIEPTSDKKIIKRAYAKKVKTCHPEEHPEEFKLLYDAYQAALEGKVTFTVSELPTVSKEQPEEMTEKVCDADFEKYQKLFDKNSEKNLEIQDKYRTLLHKCCAKKRSRRDIKELVLFLRGSEMLTIKDLDDILIMTAELVEKAPCLVPVKITRTLRDIYGFGKKYNDESDLGESARNRLYHVLEKKSIQRKKRRENIRIIIFVVFLIVSCIVSDIREKKEESSSAMLDYQEQNFESIRNILENKYPEFKIELSHKTSIHGAYNYKYEAWGVLKGETDSGFFTVKTEETSEGELIAVKDDFEVQSVELLAERSGIMCYAQVSDEDEGQCMVTGITDKDEGQYVVTGITDKNDIPEYIDGIKALAKTDTVKNINIKGIAFCGRPYMYARYLGNGRKGELPETILWEFSELQDMDEDTIRKQILEIMKRDGEP